MSRVVVLGAGISGHTAALHLRRMLGKQHEVMVVSPNSQWNWIPSNIWVGVGEMDKRHVVFPLAPVYARQGIGFRQAKAVAIRPNGDPLDSRGAVDIEFTSADKAGTTERLRYDYLINATGPRLRFEATPGLGPDGFTESVCTADHAVEANHKLRAVIERKRGALDKALATLRIAIYEAEGAEDQLLHAEMLRELGEISRALGNSGAARSAWREAVSSYAAVGASRSPSWPRAAVPSCGASASSALLRITC